MYITFLYFTLVINEMLTIYLHCWDPGRCAAWVGLGDGRSVRSPSVVSYAQLLCEGKWCSEKHLTSSKPIIHSIVRVNCLLAISYMNIYVYIYIWMVYGWYGLVWFFSMAHTEDLPVCSHFPPCHGDMANYQRALQALGPVIPPVKSWWNKNVGEILEKEQMLNLCTNRNCWIFFSNTFRHIPTHSNHFDAFGPYFDIICVIVTPARNPDMENQDVVLVVGANDVVNSAAQAPPITMEHHHVWCITMWVIKPVFFFKIISCFFGGTSLISHFWRVIFGEQKLSSWSLAGDRRLCHLGHASDWSLEIQEGDLLQAIHGWRCRFWNLVELESSCEEFQWKHEKQKESHSTNQKDIFIVMFPKVTRVTKDVVLPWFAMSSLFCTGEVLGHLGTTHGL